MTAMPRALEADYLVVGAGASGMAFADALTGHADVRVGLVDRRYGPGGHWLDAYPFVRLHQASSFYGVASTVLGSGSIQREGSEAGLHERASAAEVRAYYEQVLNEQLLPSGRVEFHPSCEYLGDGSFVSRLTGERYQAGPDCRIVDARYVAPEIPATPSRRSVSLTGSGRCRSTSYRGLKPHQGSSSSSDPERPQPTPASGCSKAASTRIRSAGFAPREPWMFDRAVLQPDPAVFIGMAADVMEAAISASSPDDLFLRMEAAGVMLRIDPSVTPTMAKTPTLARWELDLLRSIERVVRLGHVRGVEPGRIELDEGEAPIRRDAAIVHCAASGLQYPPLVPIWGDEGITIQPVRAGFPCLAAALIGYVEATREDDAEKNRLCLPSPLSDTPTDWALMQVLGGRSSLASSAEPDIKEWVDRVALNPARAPAEPAVDAELTAAEKRFRAAVGPGLAAMAELAGLSPGDGEPGGPSGFESSIAR